MAADVRAMLEAHVRLARLETKAAADSIKRLAVRLAIAAALAIVALSSLTAALADVLSSCTPLTPAGWLAIFGLLIATGAAAIGLAARRCFRQEFSGWEDSRAAIEEHVQWLGEWLDRDDDSPSDSSLS
jgi:protein-S-isoprenylcysteine O-methyltransferase Ste14